MMKRIFIGTILIVFITVVFGYQGIGDRLLRTFDVFEPLPLTATEAQKSWQKVSSSCDPNRGIAYTNSGSSSPSKSHPLTLYYTTGGQISAVGITAWGNLPQDLIGANNYWIPTNNGSYQIVVSFRSPSVICSSQQQPQTLGDRVIVNQGGVSFDVPLTAAGALKANWTKGGCIPKMGKHWSYDIHDHPNESWKVDWLVPIMPMYNQQTFEISAFLINTAPLQTGEPFGIWEGPIPGELMCYNWCSGSCNIGGIGLHLFWSTLHFMLTNPDLNTCPAHCD